MLVEKHLAVRSIDRISSFRLGVIGRSACRKGLKLSTAETILGAIEGRARTRTPRLQMVASTSSAVLYRVSLEGKLTTVTNLSLSCRVPSRRSSKPDASGSRFLGGIRGWSRGTSAMEMSFCSGRYVLSDLVLIRKHMHRRVHTRGSAIRPGVCVCTTRCINLIQQIRTPGTALSIRRSMLDLIVAIFCHVAASLGLEIL